MQETLKIGIAVKPQGVRGEIKIKPLTDDPARFNSLKEVIIDEKVYKIANVRISASEVFVMFFGINDRNEAEKFRGKFLSVTRENAIKPKKDNYFIADLIGMTVIDESGKEYGKIDEITEGNTDIIWLKNSECKRLSFPFLKRVLTDVDIKKGEMTVKADKIAEVLLVED